MGIYNIERGVGMITSGALIFNGISSAQYGLYVNYLNGAETINFPFGTDVEKIQDRPSRMTAPIHYGVNVNSEKVFSLTLTSDTYLSDIQVDDVLTWLTGHTQYKYLEYEGINKNLRYKCFINKVEVVHINGKPMGFTLDIECDGQFGYQYPETSQYSLSNDTKIRILNKSSYNGYYLPLVEIKFVGDTKKISIKNNNENNREMAFDFSDFVYEDGKDLIIKIDNKNKIITSNYDELNPYSYFNMRFIRLLRGNNNFDIATDGQCEMKVTCEFLRKVGGE